MSCETLSDIFRHRFCSSVLIWGNHGCVINLLTASLCHWGVKTLINSLNHPYLEVSLRWHFFVQEILSSSALEMLMQHHSIESLNLLGSWTDVLILFKTPVCYLKLRLVICVLSLLYQRRLNFLYIKVLWIWSVKVLFHFAISRLEITV